MSYLQAVEHPCAVCQQMHTRPFKVCEREECRAQWRRKRRAWTRRARYLFNVALGRCGDCGVTISSNERDRVTGTVPIARCAACRQTQRKQKRTAATKARQKARELRAAEAVARAQSARAEANMQRLKAGLEPSRSSKPMPPSKNIIPRSDL